MAQKLGIKPGGNVLVVGTPKEYQAWLAPLPENVRFEAKLSTATDTVHLFATSKAELQKLLTKFRAKLKPDGMVWVSWPKKSAKVETDITEDTIRQVALPMGFVDIKVCAVSEVWSGLKLVIRKKLR